MRNAGLSKLPPGPRSGEPAGVSQHPLPREAQTLRCLRATVSVGGRGRPLDSERTGTEKESRCPRPRATASPVCSPPPRLSSGSCGEGVGSCSACRSHHQHTVGAQDTRRGRSRKAALPRCPESASSGRTTRTPFGGPASASGAASPPAPGSPLAGPRTPSAGASRPALPAFS